MNKMEIIFRIDYTFIKKKEKYIFTLNFWSNEDSKENKNCSGFNFAQELIKFKLKINEIKAVLQDKGSYFISQEYDLNISSFIQKSYVNITNINDENMINYFKIIITNGNSYYIKELSFYDNFSKDISKFLEVTENKIKNMMSKSLEIKGNFDIEFCSQASSYLIHEVIGHAFEFDNAQFNSKLLTLIKNDKQLFNSSISVYDDPGYDSKMLDFGKFDCSGNKLQRTDVIKKGFFCSYIKTERSSSIREKEQYRMTNLIFEGDSSILDITYKDKSKYLFVDQISYGYYDASTGNFVVVADTIYLRDSYENNLGYKQSVKISGNIFELFKNMHVLQGVSEYHLGLCIKGNQLLAVGMKTPPLFVENLEVS